MPRPYRQFPRRRPPRLPQGSAAPYLSYWVHQVNQPLRSRVPRRQQPVNAIHEQPPYPASPSAAPYLSYWKHPVDQPFNRKARPRQQPFYQEGGVLYIANPAAPATPSVASWKKPFVQLIRRKPKEISIGGGEISSTAQVPYLSYWKQPINQPRRVVRRQQPWYSGQEPFYSISTTPAVPVVTSWIHQVNQPLKSRVLKRFQPNKFQPPYPAAPSQAPYISNWIHPVNQPLKRVRRTQPIQRIRINQPLGVNSWLPEAGQPLRRPQKRQQPAPKLNPFYSIIQTVVPILTSWLHPVNQPYKYRVKRQQPAPRRNNPFYSIVQAVVPILTSWIHPVNQPQKNQYIRLRRQQPQSHVATLLSYLSTAFTAVKILVLRVQQKAPIKITVIRPITPIKVVKPFNKVTVTAKTNILTQANGTPLTIRVIKPLNKITVVKPQNKITIKL